MGCIHPTHAISIVFQAGLINRALTDYSLRSDTRSVPTCYTLLFSLLDRLYDIVFLFLLLAPEFWLLAPILFPKPANQVTN